VTDDPTPLDLAHAAAEAAPEDVAARLRFMERVLDAELFVLLEAEAETSLRPHVFPLEAGRFVAAFDRDDRLAAFLDAPAPYAALSGRRLVRMLAGSGVGLALNVGVAPSETLLPAEAVDWLAAAAEPGGAFAAARPREIAPPADAPAALLDALAAKAPALAGLAAEAWLARLTYDDGSERLALGVVGAPEAAETAVAAAIAEAARFSGAEAAAVDVLFVGAESALRAAFARKGLRLEIPTPCASVPDTPRAPGTDPDRPPILR
jgi:hypothetical protein